MEPRRPTRIRFAPEVSPQQQQSLRQILSCDVAEADRFDGYRRSVKEFYRLESPEGPLFVKVRRFPSWIKRLKNAVRRTKGELEFEHLLALRRLRVPCPAPLAVARIGGAVLVRETRLAMEFVADAAPLRRILVESDEATREATLDRLMDFLRLLDAKGVVPRDLHWENLLVRPSAAGPEFLLIDALHVRRVGPPAGAEFAPSVEWLLAYMLHQDAPREVVRGLLNRLGSLDLPALADRQALLDRARRTAELLR